MFTRFRSLRLGSKRREQEKTRSLCLASASSSAAITSTSSSSTSVFYYDESLYEDPDYPLPAATVSSRNITSKSSAADFKRSISEPLTSSRKIKRKSKASAVVDAELDDVIRMMTGSSSVMAKKSMTRSFAGNPKLSRSYNFDSFEDDEGFASGDAADGVKRRQRTYTPPWLKEDWTRKQAVDYVFLELSYPGAFIVRRPQHWQPDIDSKDDDASIVRERHVYSITAMNHNWQVLIFQIFETECEGFGAESDAGLKTLHFKDSVPHLDLNSMIAYYHENPVPSEKGDFLLKPAIVRESLMIN